MNIHKTSKTIAVIAAVATGLLATFSVLLSYGGNGSGALNGLCFTALFVMLAAYVVSRFTEKKS